jgi:hypothetical protein
MYLNQCFGLKYMYLSGTSKVRGESSISRKRRARGVDLLGGSRLKSSISIGDRPLVLGPPMRRGCCWTSNDEKKREARNNNWQGDS